MRFLLLLFVFGAPALAASPCEDPLYISGNRVIAGTPRLHLQDFRSAFFPGDQGDMNFMAKTICQLCGWGTNVDDAKLDIRSDPSFVVHFDEHNQIDDIIWNKRSQLIISALSCSK